VRSTSRKNDEQRDSSTASEFDAWLAAGTSWEPPTTDADGNPLDDWEPR
jgi:hypothetical protein